jgi:hypothetical protein
MKTSQKNRENKHQFDMSNTAAGIVRQRGSSGIRIA